MDLFPFSLIDPCGNPEIVMTQMKDFLNNITLEQIQPILINSFSYLNGYKEVKWINKK